MTVKTISVRWLYQPEMKIKDLVIPEMWMCVAKVKSQAFMQPVPVTAYEDEKIRASIERACVDKVLWEEPGK